jgi:hypothetical protein
MIRFIRIIAWRLRIGLDSSSFFFFLFFHRFGFMFRFSNALIEL